MLYDCCSNFWHFFICPNHKPLLGMTPCFWDYISHFPKFKKIQVILSLVEDKIWRWEGWIEYGRRCFIWLSQNQRPITYPIHIHTPQFLSLPIQPSPAHISYLYKAGVSWLASPLKAPHICLPETWNQWLLHMRQLHLHPCPSPNVTRSTYFGKKIFVFAKRSTYVDKEINTFVTMRKLYIHHHPAPLYPQELSSAHPSSQISWKRLKVNKFSCRSCAI